MTHIDKNGGKEKEDTRKEGMKEELKLFRSVEPDLLRGEKQRMCVSGDRC